MTQSDFPGIRIPEFTFGIPKLQVIDKAVTFAQLKPLWDYSQLQAHWEFKNRGTSRDPLTSWVADILNYFQQYEREERLRRWEELGQTMPFMHSIWDTVTKFVPDQYEIRRTFLNGHTFALGDGIHDDGAGTFTFLLYANLEWMPAWGGETMFYNEQKDDVIAAVLPKPGRLICFDGRIPHAGRAPNRYFSGMRVTLAFQTQRVDRPDSNEGSIGVSYQ